MTILVTFELSHTEEQTPQIKDFFCEILPDTRSFEGNLSAQLFEKPQGGNALVLQEEWRSPAHFDKYIEWRKAIGDFDRLGSLLTQAPQISQLSKVL
ncbi:putative quinol monooxygenase [Aeromonas schubertii]|uniref:Antibiotic biosynthesis monooxygenase n=1 Tax=Aeromonas schubertii TaxID=652 RepID=A0ABS7VHJ2_9GAMM|nr:antibiotic biosynthesis monooxygenase family protein [Aeromonas schubertii]MBZ6068512.1 antibiotic biosynthesis monooxygenase [Aeromonas schubertii]